MTQYFFLATALPALELDVEPELSYEELETLLKENLLQNDYEQITLIRRYYDILNIRALWKEEELSPYGSLDPNMLSEALLEGTVLPDYVDAFLDLYKTKEERVEHFPLLLTSFFKDEINHADPFLREYFRFERRLRLVLLGFRAKALGRSLAAELQYEDPKEDLIAQIMAQKDAPEYEPPEGFEDLKSIFATHYAHPQDLYQALVRYRFDAVDAMKGIDVFAFRSILAYLIQFILVEQWQQLDKKKGLDMMDRILEGQA